MKARPSGPSKEHLRDIAILSLGIVLAKAERSKQILNSIPEGSFCWEIDSVINELREGKTNALSVWLSDRQVILENGKDVVTAIASAISLEAQRQQVKAIVLELSQAIHLEDPESLKARLKECVTRLEGVPNGRVGT